MKQRRGQALIEFALLAPVLLIVLGAVVYFGGVLLADEKLAIAARAAARAEALAAAQQNLSTGALSTASGGARQKAIRDAGGAGLNIQSKGVDWGAVASHAHGPGHLVPIDGYTAVLEDTGIIDVGNGHSYKAGIGVAFYGVTLQRRLDGLTPFGRLLKLVTPNANTTSVSATELGVRAGAVPGILGLNEWIGRIVAEPLK